MKITVTGYFGSGSSAAMDLLEEYSCNGSVVSRKAGGYEHTTLYHPGGLFDLEDKLLIGNDMHRSDEAIRTFREEMMRLNSNNFGWFGSFEMLFGDRFERILNSYIQSFASFRLSNHYYGQCKKVIFNPLKIVLQLMAKILLGRTIYVWGREFVYNPSKEEMLVTFPTDTEFYNNSKVFVDAYMNLYKEEGKDNILFDRLLLCQHLYRMPNYFGDDFRAIRVKRDIRDLYILNNYIWKRINAGTMYPQGIDAFCNFWRRLKQTEKSIDDSRILTINFEDLIYHYEETVKLIEKHCGLEPSFHVSKKQIFIPEKSIKNTQVYKINDEWKAEIEVLEKMFPEDIYEFPCDNITEISSMFDDSTTERKIGLIEKIKLFLKD